MEGKRTQNPNPACPSNMHDLNAYNALQSRAVEEFERTLIWDLHMNRRSSSSRYRQWVRLHNVFTNATMTTTVNA